MTEETVVLLHGFASSGNSSKAQFLREKFEEVPAVSFVAMDFNPTAADFEHMTVTGMINRLRQVVIDRISGDLTLVGSSMGALVGLHYAHRYGGVKRLLLLAPALQYGRLTSEAEREQWQYDGFLPVHHFAFNREIPLRYQMALDGVQYNAQVAPPAPITIIHGRHDDVVPIELSRQYAAAHPRQVELIEVESDHRLSDQLPLIWRQLSF